MLTIEHRVSQAPIAQTFVEALAKGEADVLALDLIADRAIVRDSTSPSNTYRGTASGLVTTQRLSSAGYYDAGGAYVWTADQAAMRFDHDPATGEMLGVTIEPARTRYNLYPRDLTGPAWVATSMSVSRTAMGIDKIANTASRLTALANGATLLQSVTLASGSRALGVSLRRVSGSGEVAITIDGGVTWTPVAVTGDFVRAVIAPRTLANPVIGIRLATSGDQVDADAVQLENNPATSPIFGSETAQVTRAVDNIRVLGSQFPLRVKPASLLASIRRLGSGDTADEGLGVELNSGLFQNSMIQPMIDSGSFNRPALRWFRSATPNQTTGIGGLGNSSPNYVPGEPPRTVGAAWADGDSIMGINGILGAVSALVWPATSVSRLSINPNSEGSQGSGVIARVRWVKYVPRRLPNAELQADLVIA